MTEVLYIPCHVRRGGYSSTVYFATASSLSVTPKPGPSGATRARLEARVSLIRLGRPSCLEVHEFARIRKRLHAARHMHDGGHAQIAFRLRADHHRALERLAQRRDLAPIGKAGARNLDHQDGQRVDIDLMRDVADGEIALVAGDGDVDGMGQPHAVALVFRVDGFLEVVQLTTRGVVDLLRAEVGVELVAVDVEQGIGGDHLAQQWMRRMSASGSAPPFTLNAR